MRNQTKVLQVLWKKQKKMNADEISSFCKLTRRQVLDALRSLKQRGLVISHREKKEYIGNKSPPFKKALYERNKRVLDRISNLMLKAEKEEQENG